jgi:hypothetical protein
VYHTIKRKEAKATMTSLIRKLVCVTLLLTTLVTVAYSDDTASPETADTEQSKSVEMPLLSSTFPSLKMGIDVYSGTSNMPGSRWMSDGMWAGAGAYYPSITYLQWNTVGERTVKLSMGMGDLYTDPESTLNQPVEAYWQAPMGKAVVTLGKFWVPFAQQEWLYEAKPGIMAQWAGERSSLVASTNYNTDSSRQNLYFRAGYKAAEDAEFGLSVALGDGFCSGSVHRRGIAMDTTIGFAGCRLYGEYNHFSARESGNDFRYISGKLCYEKLKALTPFVGVYKWDDDSDTFGRFRSTVYGLEYQISPTLAIQGAVAATSDGDVSWLQLHWNWERDFPLQW